jgi:predicted DNA-binding transcriptional regulator YafY
MKITIPLSGKQFAELGQAQRERLAYIEFKIYFFGKVGRQDLMKRFGVASAGATRDFAAYREFAPNNIEFDNAEKVYVIRDGFSPIFKHMPERVMTALSNGFGDGINPIAGPLIPCEMPPPLNRLNISILAPISRAINLGEVVCIKYFSDSSGSTQREIVPFSFATDGLRWHVRAYDRKRSEFLDFVISRMDEASIVHGDVPLKHELPTEDHQWNRVVEIDLVPHPDRDSAELVKRDYGMVDGVLHLKTRAAMVGYILQQWHVDCSVNHYIQDKAFRLWLKDPLVLYGVKSAIFAPGYGKQSIVQNSVAQ